MLNRVESPFNVHQFKVFPPLVTLNLSYPKPVVTVLQFLDLSFTSVWCSELLPPKVTLNGDSHSNMTWIVILTLLPLLIHQVHQLLCAFFGE